MPTGVVDPKFKGAGRTRGLEIWRIKKFDLDIVPKEQHGNFFAGDSYIVLNTKSSSEWDVHFWLGKDTSQDEMGTAAIKTVELDDSLGGLPVQYREVQGHESTLFLSYFKGSGIKYLEGGHATGFEHVVDPYDNFKPRLFHCKGKRNVRSTQVKAVIGSLNLGDVFLLDKGLDLYVWMPPESGRLERVKGMSMAKGIRDLERAGRPKVHVLDKDWNTNADFWKTFGGKDKVAQVKPAEAGGSDENYWRENRETITLWKVSDASGKMNVTKVSQGGLNHKSLDTNDAFIVDAGKGGLFVWVGKGCTMDERKKAMDWGQQYLAQKKLPVHTPVTRVLESAEPASFMQWFTDWKSQGKTSSFKARLFQCSNESGKLSIEESSDFSQEGLDGDDVMILDGLNIIYVWVGSGANPAERDAAQSTAKVSFEQDLYQRSCKRWKPLQKYLETDSVPRHKTATIEVIYQGKEPPTFKKYFPSWNEKLFAGDRSAENMRKLLFADKGKVQSFSH